MTLEKIALPTLDDRSTLPLRLRTMSAESLAKHGPGHIMGLHQDAMRLRKKFDTDAYWKNDVLYWNSNDAVVPPHCFEEAYVKMPLGQQAARDIEVDKSLAAYRKARANMTDEQRAEEAFEQRAAFGPGVDVVNVLTGERTRT